MSKMSELAARKWDTYWTEAERAGLKAMGRMLTEDDWHVADYDCWDIIRAYVKAARKVKEGK